MKKTCKQSTFIAIVLLIFSFSAKAQCLYAWKYNVPIVVTNNTTTSLSEYQVKLTVNTSSPILAGKMISTGDDIRFVDSGSCNTMPYWIESGMNTATTVIWVKLPKLPSKAHRTIKMFYGNPSAIPASNGDSTFLIFDNFPGSQLSTKWQNYENNAMYSILGNELTITSGSGTQVGTSIFVSYASFTSPVIAEMMVDSATGYYTHLGLVNSGTLTGYTLFFGANAGANNGMHMGKSFSNGGSFSTSFIDTNAKPGNLSGTWSMAWPASNIQAGSWPGGSFKAASTGLTLGGSVQVAFGMDWTSIGTTAIKWVRARNYASSEAAATVGQEELTGIDNPVLANSLKIYPNPVHDMLYIDFSNSKYNFETIDLLNIDGRTIGKYMIPQGSSTTEIPTQNIARGMYFLRINGKSESFVQKITLD
jgi:hypothetical protein